MTPAASFPSKGWEEGQSGRRGVFTFSVSIRQSQDRERKTAGTKATVALAGKGRVGDTLATSNYRRFLDEREEVPL